MSVRYPDKKSYKNSVKKILDDGFGKEKTYQKLIKKSKIIFAIMLVFIIVAVNYKQLNAAAKKFKNNFFGYFNKNNEQVNYDDKDLSEKVISNVIKDKNEHIGFELMEFLTDGVYGYYIVKYTVFDEIGKKWMNEICALNEYADHMVFSIHPLFIGNKTVDYGVNYSISDPKIMYELCNDEEYYFCSSYKTSGFDYQSGKVRLNYELCDDNACALSKESEIKVDEIMPFVRYELLSDENVPFEAKYIFVSGLTYLVYGSNNKNDFRRYSISIITEKGIMKADKNDFWGSGASHPCKQNEYCNYLFACGVFPYEDQTLNNRTVKAFDPESIEGVIIEHEGKKYEYKVKKIVTEEQ